MKVAGLKGHKTSARGWVLAGPLPVLLPWNNSGRDFSRSLRLYCLASFGFLAISIFVVKRFWLALTVLLLLGSGDVVFAQTAVLHGVIKDAATGKLSACTVAITDANGKTVIESDSFKTGFRCAGEFTKELPPGRTHLRITRGFETKAVTHDIDLVANRQTDLNVFLDRMVDLRKYGWYAGDSHVHMLHGERTVPVDFDFVALTARAEDLQYLSLAQDWSLPQPTPEALEAELRPRSTPDCFLTWNLEAPKNYYKGDAGRCLGHCWNVGMRGRTREGRDVVRELLEASAWDYESAKPSYANFESHHLVHKQGGAVFYTHPARWWMGSWGGQGGYQKVERMRISNMAVELPLDVLIGPTFDGLDVLTTSGEQTANTKAFELWSLLLNHGYRLSATASSDACFDRPGGGVPGGARTYAFLPHGFSLPAAVRALAAGSTFATTGPLLVASLDHEPPGTVFSPSKSDRLLKIEAWASGDSSSALSRVEVLRNGKICDTFPLNAQTDHFQMTLPVREQGKAWYCIRAFEGLKDSRLAVSGPFYFVRDNREVPPPVPARVHAKIVDADSGQPLGGKLTEITFEGTQGVAGKRHVLKTGEGTLAIVGMARLRAESEGHRPLILSPFLDNPKLLETITSLGDTDLLNWNTFERIREQLSEVELVFRLSKK